MVSRKLLVILEPSIMYLKLLIHNVFLKYFSQLSVFVELSKLVKTFIIIYNISKTRSSLSLSKIFVVDFVLYSILQTLKFLIEELKFLSLLLMRFVTLRKSFKS